MFDGNHRSNRRQVNLGGRSTQSLSKKSILAQSQRQRDERKRKQLQEQAACHAQRLLRGMIQRRQLSKELDRVLAQPDSDLSLPAFQTALNVRLGLLPYQPDVFDQRITRLERRTTQSTQNMQSTQTQYRPSHRIVQYALQRLQQQPDNELYTSVLQRQAVTPQSYTTIGGRAGFLILIDTILQLERKNRSLTILHAMARRVAPDTLAGRAALGLVQLASSEMTTPINALYTEALLQVALETDSEGTDTDNTNTRTSENDQLETQLRKTIRGNESHLLVKSLQRIPQVALILLHRLWNVPILETTGCVIRDESFDAHARETWAQADMDEESDEEDEASIHKGKKTTRQEFLTIPKLDRHLDEIQRNRRKSVLPVAVQSHTTVELAQLLGQPQLWLDWASNIYESEGNSASSRDIRAAYVALLSSLLGTTTGLKARQSARSAFLTKLAFHPKFCQYLWQSLPEINVAMVKDPTILHTLLVFADVFAHQLIALRDDQFLQRCTEGTLQASSVVERFRDFLYHLYWLDPVKAQDFETNDLTNDNVVFIRARLILSGTKLWNSLHERWCRLHPSVRFCEESTWLFPPVVSLVGGNTVIGDVNDMDIDSDSEEENQYHNSMDAESDALANAFGDPKMARILTYIPQALPFEKRVKLFDSLLQHDKDVTQNEDSETAMLAMMRGTHGAFGRERVEIRRDKLYEDSMTQLGSLGKKLKRKVQVSFINQHGTQEAGIDGGGVFKEFIDDLIKEAFMTSAENSSVPPLFTVTPLQTLAINPDEEGNAALFPHYEFLGKVLGKAVYESILVEPQFCLPFLNLLLGCNNSLDDLKNFDPEYHRHLTQLLVLDPNTLVDMGLTFELSIGNNPVRTIEIVPGGKQKQLTGSNVVEYVHTVANYRLNVLGAQQVKAFLRGFQSIIPSPWVRLFSSYELQKLISGDDSVQGVDVTALKASMQYAAGYHPSQPIIQYFWEVVSEMTPEQQRKFLRFMTSCSRQPLLGFSSLEPLPCVQQIRLPDELFERPASVVAKEAPLPTSSTCMNLLKLPNYRSKDLLRSKLLAAIESGAGFELT